MQESSAIKKNNIFSIMKGIAIISVVIGHCCRYEGVEPFVNQYHLAVFFFVAGYFFKDKYLQDVKGFVIKKVKSLYVPFVLSGLCFLALHNILVWMHVYDSPVTLEQMGEGVFDLCIRLTSNESLMGAMWFCPTLLWVSVFSVFAMKAVENNGNHRIGGGNIFSCLCKNARYKGYAAIILMVLIASVALHVVKLKSPYCIWQNMIVCGIFLEGLVFKDLIEEQLVDIKQWQWIFVVLCLGLILWNCTTHGIFGRLQPANINEENTFVILLIGFAGSLMVYGMSKVIDGSFFGKLIAMAGNHSFSIMLLHFLAFKVVNLIQCWWYDLPMATIAQFPTMFYDSFGWFMAYVIIGTSLPVMVSIGYQTMKYHLRNE